MQLSENNDVLNRKIQAIRIVGNDRLLSSSISRTTVQEYQYEISSMKTNASEKIIKEDGQVAVENNKRDKT